MGINLLFDGLTNSTQDYIFQTHKPYSGPQMMCAVNMLNTVLTGSFLAIGPYVAMTGLGQYLGMQTTDGGSGEVVQALAFMARHPRVWADVLGFAACGAVGQVFICEYSVPRNASFLSSTPTWSSDSRMTAQR